MKPGRCRVAAAAPALPVSIALNLLQVAKHAAQIERDRHRRIGAGFLARPGLLLSFRSLG
jgi:hypothetical protein